MSPRRASLNEPSVAMNNVPFKRPTLADAQPLFTQPETLIGCCPHGPPSRDHPQRTLIGQALVCGC